MARPVKQGLDYFPHDTDASMDEKIEGIEALFGLEGYAVYFKLCERIYRTHDGELDISDAETRKIYARNMHISLNKFDTILEALVKRGLFDPELFQKTARLSSCGIKKRISRVTNKRLLMSEKYQEAKLKQGISDAETREETCQKPDKEKKRKEKETIPPIIPQEQHPNIFTLYEKNIGMLTPMMGDQLKDAETQYPADWITEAFQEAVNNNKRNWKYIETILKRWKQDGRGNNHKPAGRIPAKYTDPSELEENA